MGSSEEELVERIRRDLADSYDEELELELEGRNLDQLAEGGGDTASAQYKADRRRYFQELFRIKGELEVEHASIVLPPRERHDDYVRRPVPREIVVPEVY